MLKGKTKKKTAASGRLATGAIDNGGGPVVYYPNYTKFLPRLQYPPDNLHLALVAFFPHQGGDL